MKKQVYWVKKNRILFENLIKLDVRYFVVRKLKYLNLYWIKTKNDFIIFYYTLKYIIIF